MKGLLIKDFKLLKGQKNFFMTITAISIITVSYTHLLQKETLIKYYDLIRPTRCVIEESQRYLRLEHEDKRCV